MGTCLTIGLPLASTFKTYLPPQGRGGSTEKRPYAQVFFGTLGAGSAATSLKRSWLGKMCSLCGLRELYGAAHSPGMS